MKLTSGNVRESLPLKRIKYDLTQTQLANLSGLSRLTISFIETGKVEPVDFTILKLNLLFDKLREERVIKNNGETI